MASDVEFNVTASDKSGMALASAERNFKASQERMRKESEKTSKKVGDDLVTSADKAGKGIVGTLLPQFSKAGTMGGQALVVGMAAAGPLIGATISAAVIGGAGIGGVLGGVALASRDPRVAAAGKQLGETLLSSLERDAAPFVDPLLDNIAKIEIRFQAANNRIKAIFQQSSTFLDPLVDGALDGLDGILRGVQALVANAEPVISQMGKSLSDLGDTAGDSFEIIAGGSEGAAEALSDITKVIQFLIISSAMMVRALTEVYHWLTFIPRKVEAWERSLVGWEEEAKVVGDSTKALIAVQRTFATVALSAGEAAGDAGMHMLTYADAMQDATEKGRGLYDSQTQVADALADARKALKDNSATLDINTEKGRANRDALSRVAGTLTDNYQAYVKVNGEGAAAQKVAETNRATFMRLAGQFGLTKKQAADLANQFGLIPANKTTTFHANTHDAAARAAALSGALDRAARDRTANVTVVINTGRLASIEQRLNRLGGSLYNAAGVSWSAVDGASGVARTGGPTPVSVSNSIAVMLDGHPFENMTVRAVRANSQRDAWRTKTGRRV